VLRSVASCSALAVVLLGLSASPARAELPPFGALTGAANPLNGLSTGATSFSRAGLGDLDGDGDTDLATGTGAGTFAVHYFPEPARALLLGVGSALLALLRRRRG
jgi:FG-GAP repeat